MGRAGATEGAPQAGSGPLALALDRAAPASLTEQISTGLRTAIEDGRLAPGGRLPSWRDLASQLGVARGTVRAAYEELIDAQLVQTHGAAGTRVVRQAPPRPPGAALPMAQARDPFDSHPRVSGVFQMGVPAQDAFPAKPWARMLARAARSAASAPLVYPDGRGEPALRAAIAATLAVARGLACSPAQIFVTSGLAASLALAVRTLGLRGTAWTEDPGYPPARRLLAALGLAPQPVPVDAQGLDVAAGQAAAPHAAMALVTPGQQAPLGVALSPARRRALLDWAERSGAWIVEDDYLGELQLQGRAAPALGAQDPEARVLHIGTFSKTISPALRLGFLVVPASEVARFDEAVALHGGAPAPLLQHAVAEFLQGGHQLRHLRRMKSLYARRRDALCACLEADGITHRAAGLAVLLRLPDGVSDQALARTARAHGLAPVPLSLWYAQPQPRHAGLLLGVTNVREEQAAAHWALLAALIRPA
ncbi:MocR-like pyridoxine biosynthesis transcription factor PdxR [Pseudorhodoferax sp.]|uniref:MocR-like pyridoxine biosynthesis transcription factor PdxR n=1 Tax=Pseudorhodoferax sp. TaxID=1993553 RepID=UPI002DD64636|nr:PLP-dependent aminotransferase family protein [Pseudorhodoferax sp.]